MALLAAWRVLLGPGQARVGGYDWPHMKSYLFVAFACGALVGTFVDFRMSHRIQSGLVALDLPARSPVSGRRTSSASCGPGRGSHET